MPHLVDVDRNTGILWMLSWCLPCPSAQIRPLCNKIAKWSVCWRFQDLKKNTPRTLVFLLVERILCYKRWKRSAWNANQWSMSPWWPLLWLLSFLVAYHLRQDTATPLKISCSRRWNLRGSYRQINYSDPIWSSSIRIVDNNVHQGDLPNSNIVEYNTMGRLWFTHL